jgi:spore maturation protein SpmA/spore maturation protein SpmB
MALSRFWLSIIIASILFAIIGFGAGKIYSIDFLINGKKDDLLLVNEAYLKNASPFLQDTLVNNKEGKYVKYGMNNALDSTYVYSNGIIKVFAGKQNADGLLPTCKNTITDIVLPLIAYLAFFCGLMQLLIDSGASAQLAKFCSPFFVKIFPDIPANHPSISYMTLNFAANFLGLDSAATPFGLKAMESLQTLNTSKDNASNAQIMFMCLHAAGLCLIPTSIIGYRAAQGAANPADVMLPCIITSLVGTLAALFFVGFRQKISFKNVWLLSGLALLIGAIVGLLYYINSMHLIQKNYFTNAISSIVLLLIILGILVYAWYKEKMVLANGVDVFSSFVNGARQGLQTGITIFPYILGMLAAICIFRNSGLFEIIAHGLSSLLQSIGLSKSITDAMPVALLRPFSSGGSRGFMIDAMRTYGADSFTGRLSSIFQCSAETTFYVIAVYFGSIKIKNTRYTLSTMLMVDAICVIAAIAVALIFW